MEILGIGVPELVFILLIALIVLGPSDMRKAGKTFGKGLNTIVRSDTWKSIRSTSRRLSTLPNELMREANLDDLGEELEDFRQRKFKSSPSPNDQYGAWSGSATSSADKENRIAPPVEDKPAVTKKTDHPNELGSTNFPPADNNNDA